MSIPQLSREANGYYYAKWSDNRRSRRKSMGTQDRAVAEERFAHWLLMRRAPEAPAQTYTVGDAWAVYYERHVRASGKTETADFSWKNLGPYFADLVIEAVTQDSIDDYVSRRVAGRIGRPSTPATCRRELALLVAALNFCAKRPYQLYDPSSVSPLTLPAASKPRERWLTIEEMQRLFAAAAEARRGRKLSRAERFLWLALETAARKSAIMDLTWSRVDFDLGVIHYATAGEQSTKRRASVPISRALRPVLERAYAERENDLVMGKKTDAWYLVDRVAKRAGVAGVSPHVMRHTAATHMARNGVPLWTVAKVLGNSMAVVERTYAKWCPSDAERNVDLISGAHLLGHSAPKLGVENGKHRQTMANNAQMSGA